MRYLIGVDGTAGCLAAVRFLKPFLAEETDPVLLYYSPPEIAIGGAQELAPELVAKVHGALTEAVFEKAIAELPLEHRAGAVKIEGTQTAKHGLLVAAEEHRADMIVVGSHGVRRFDWLRIGGVGRALAHTATVPLLVVRDHPRPEGRPFRILVTCDRTNTANCPKSLIKKIAWPADTEAVALSVYESYLGDVPEWIKETLAREGGLGANVPFEPFLEEKHQARGELETWCNELPLNFRKLPPKLVEGHAADAILAELAAEPYDLVVLGAHRQRQLSQMLLGSTSHSVLTHAPCSVLIVREHECP